MLADRKTATWEDDLVRAAVASGAEPTRVQQQTLMHDGMEGLYIKVETDAQTVDRYKWVRPDFVQAILDGDGHHQHRMLLPNRLNPNQQNIFEYPGFSMDMNHG